METIIDNTNISKHLGQKSPRIEQYTPSLLVRELRQNNRQKLEITNDINPPFVGYDSWLLWEISGLMDNGLPFTALGKLVYACNNKYIVESKSLKLYFNSFNMTKLGKTKDIAMNELRKLAIKDLSNLLETSVDFELFDSESTKNVIPFTNFNRIEDQFTPTCSIYKENKSILRKVPGNPGNGCRFTVYTTLLKSNCMITFQKDEGTLYIDYTASESTINILSLLEYIVSFRNVNEFHESTLETIFTRLNETYKPSRLMVAALYCRRGGIAITPIRALSKKDLPENIINPCIWSQTIRQ